MKEIRSSLTQPLVAKQIGMPVYGYDGSSKSVKQRLTALKSFDGRLL